MKNDPIRILFLCTGNSCRSQMAEGWARSLKSDVLEAYSAGIHAHGVNPYAVAVMAEAGIDISSQRSKTLEEVDAVPFDYVVTLCDNAREFCPIFPGKAKIVHQGFEDPPILAASVENMEEKLNCYRRVRDAIGLFITQCPDILEKYL